MTRSPRRRAAPAPPSPAEPAGAGGAPGTARRAASAAVILAGLSAMAAGAHEVAWSRLLGRAAGNTAVGVGVTLAAFMIGSGLGAILVQRTALWRRPRRAYVAAELAIGLGGLALLGYCLHAPPPSRLGLGLAADVLVASVVACVPALAMGATYPLLVEASATREQRTVRPLYAAGLVGVVAGTLGGALLVAPALGLDVLALLACGANVALAVLAREWLPADGLDDAALHVPPGREDAGAIARFAAAGVIGLGAQTVWNRAAAPYAGVSTFTFAAIVAIYVLAQALGFALLARARDARRAAAGDLALAAAPVLALLSLAVVGRAVDLPSRDGEPSAWLSAILAIVTVVVGPAALALGVSQAAALHRVESRDDAWGRRAGLVAGLGTIASAAGSLFASLVGIPLIGPRWTLAACALPALLVLASSPARRTIAGGAALALVALAIAAPGPRWFLGAAYDGAPIYFAEHGVQDTSAVIAVDRPVEPRIRRLVAAGVSYSGDSLYAQRYMRLLAHLPALAARGERRALLICIGTGTTLDALRAYDYERIDAVDISPTIDRALAFFEHVNHRAAADPRVAVIVDDGARYLRRAETRYDVITLEPPPPRAPGASSLYSIEFYEAARARLEPGGAIAQWLPLHGMSGAELAVLIRTFSRVFEGATLHLSERNEAVLLAVIGAPASGAARALASDRTTIGLGDADPVRDTFVMGGAALSAVIGEGAVVRDMWPMPEYAPLAGASEADLGADELLEQIAEASEAAPGTFAATLLPAVAPFLRLERQRGDARDRALVTSAMRAWLSRDPRDAYVQHAFGYGPLLEARIERLERAGELSEADASRARALLARQRDGAD